MSIDRNGWFVDTFAKALTNVIALDLSATSAFKLAMFTDSLVPNFSQTNPAYGTSPLNTAEVSGTGYTAGGQTLSVTSFAELAGNPGKTGWKLGTVTWADSTITGAKGALIYVPGLSNRAVLIRNFGVARDTQAGTFEITFDADGVWRQNLIGPAF